MTVTDYSISPNPLAFGCILTLWILDGAANSYYLETSELVVPCHNEKTAYWIANNWHIPAVRSMALSFANR